MARRTERNCWRLMSDYARYAAVALSQTLINRIDPVQFSLIQIWLATLKMSKTQVKACPEGEPGGSKTFWCSGIDARF